MRKLKGGNSCLTCGVAVAAAALAVSKPAHAAFTLVDDFNRADNVQVGEPPWSEVDGDTNYNGADPQIALVNNQMRLYSDTAINYNSDMRSYTTANLVTTATQTIFFQMTLTTDVHAPADNWNAGFGLSNKNNANSHGRDLFTFYANGPVNGSGPTVLPISVNAGTAHDMTGLNAVATTGTMTVGTQANFWMVLDNTAHTMSLYENTGSAGATGADLIASNVAYGGSTLPLDPLTLVFYANSVNFQTENGGGGAGADGSNSFSVDNVYTDTASNLANPVPEPASLGLLAMAGASLFLPRRRRA